MTKSITLTQGKSVLVDDEDFEKLNQHKWYYHQGYAFRKAGPRIFQVSIFMHREIMQTPDGMETDHINGDSLDNRRENLRICTHAENLRNRKMNSGNKSGYKGVYWFSQRGKWRAAITLNGKNVHLGLFTDPADAAKAYDKAAQEHFGEFARTNL